MSLAKKRQCEVQSPTLERRVVADSPPETVRCLAHLAAIPEQRAEIVLTGRVRLCPPDAAPESLLCLGRATEKVERNSTLIENSWRRTAKTDAAFARGEGISRPAQEEMQAGDRLECCSRIFAALQSGAALPQSLRVIAFYPECEGQRKMRASGGSPGLG